MTGDSPLILKLFERAVLPQMLVHYTEEALDVVRRASARIFRTVFVVQLSSELHAFNVARYGNERFCTKSKNI